MKIEDRKWAVKDREHGEGVVTLDKVWEEDGEKMCQWSLILPKFPYGVYSEGKVEDLLSYLEKSGAERHWTVWA